MKIDKYKKKMVAHSFYREPQIPILTSLSSFPASLIL